MPSYTSPPITATPLPKNSLPKRVRDYRAEYQRRVEKAKAKGLTRAQARRGARKYATEAPREHVQRAATTRAKYGATPAQVTRKKLARRVVKGVGEHRQNIATFHGLNRAMDYAGSLPADSQIFIAAHGKFRNPTKYKGQAHGWLILTQLSRPNVFRHPVERDNVKQHDEELFTPHAATYEVRWL